MSWDQCPELHSHKRHGHNVIFIPSWQYIGFVSGAAQVLNNAIRVGIALQTRFYSLTIASAVRALWRQYLPNFYIPQLTLHDPDTPQRATTADEHFNIDFVSKRVAYLSMLVMMGIGRCTSRCLAIRFCPNLFESVLVETFPVERDPLPF